MQDINEKQNIEIAEIKTEIKNIKEMVQDLNAKVNLIATNCIPTLTKEIAKMDANQKVFMAFMFAVVAALIGLYFK